MTKNILSFFKSIETVSNALVRMVVSIFTFAITEVTPLVAPLPPAFSIYTAMHDRLHVPVYVAVIAAAAIEITGMFSSKVSIRCYQWNKARKKTDESIPQVLSVAMTSVFFVVVLLLAFTVEIAPSLTALVIPGFVLIAISVYVNLAIHTNLERMEVDKAENAELRDEKNGLAAQVRQAKKELEKLTGQQGEVAKNVNIGRSKLATLTAELAISQQARNDIEAEISAIKKMTSSGQKRGQNDVNWPANGKNPEVENGHFGPGNLIIANESKQDKINARRSKMAALLQENDRLTNKELAELLRVGVSTIKADKKALNGSLVEL
jgi:hypothetical protein